MARYVYREETGARSESVGAMRIRDGDFPRSEDHGSWWLEDASDGF